MSWTTPGEVKKKLLSWWDKGKLLRSEADPTSLFPLQIKLKGPSSAELSSRFADVSDWIRRLVEADLPLKMRHTQHRIIGANEIPTHALFQNLDQVCRLIGKRSELAGFRRLLNQVREVCPEVVPWLEKRPLRALELSSEWERLLRVVLWLRERPQPQIYLRQVDLPGIDTKFLENHKGVLGELFTLALPFEYYTPEAASFEERFGFKTRPVRIRFRPLSATPAYPGCWTDITVPKEDFAQLDPSLGRVFVVENEINYLAFPKCHDALVIFGSGYKVGALRDIEWMKSRPLYYWGDIDTHGFAILNQLRSYHPHTQSFLMDRETFLTHEAQWVEESTPTRNPLALLDAEEQALYQDLIHGEYGENRRLEQELVGFGRVLGWVGALDLD